MQEESKPYIMALLFIIFVLPFFIYYYFDFCCWLGLVIPSPEPEKPLPSEQVIKAIEATKQQVEPEQLEQDPDWSGTWNDKPDDSWFDPEPQTDSQIIKDVISGLQNLGFKKKDAKLAVLKACENKVFEDHQSLIEAALEKSSR